MIPTTATAALLMALMQAPAPPPPVLTVTITNAPPVGSLNLASYAGTYQFGRSAHHQTTLAPGIHASYFGRIGYGNEATLTIRPGGATLQIWSTGDTASGPPAGPLTGPAGTVTY